MENELRQLICDVEELTKSFGFERSFQECAIYIGKCIKTLQTKAKQKGGVWDKDYKALRRYVFWIIKSECRRVEQGHRKEESEG